MSSLPDEPGRPVSPPPTGDAVARALSLIRNSSPGQTPPSHLDWSRKYGRALAITDVGVMLIAVGLGYVVRFGDDEQVSWLTYLSFGLGVAVVWSISLLAVGAYEMKYMTTGTEEFKRIARGSGWALGVVGVASFIAGFDAARLFVAISFVVGTALLMIMRYVLRRIVGTLRARGEWRYRMVAVGSTEAIEHLVTATARSPYSNLEVVAACIDGFRSEDVLPSGVPIEGRIADVALVADRLRADVVAVAGEGMRPQQVRELGWELEGSGREMVMAPALTEVAGPRVHVSPVEGLPLMWVEQPQFTGLSRVVKRAVDLVGAVAVALALSPLLLATALAVKLTSAGPVFFRQSRLGVMGQEFQVLKFRSMFRGAEARRAELLAMNEQDGDGVLFKIAEDPRVTPVGRWIRRLSIDELPQLWNVIRGHMSLVGPRPLATIDSIYDGHARRRLLVRPGMTGLWQVSGRSDTSWDDAVRLDLYYVENWSLLFDAAIVLRTVWTVLKRSGAY